MLGGERKIDSIDFQKWFEGLTGKRMPLIRGEMTTNVWNNPQIQAQNTTLSRLCKFLITI